MPTASTFPEEKENLRKIFEKNGERVIWENMKFDKGELVIVGL